MGPADTTGETSYSRSEERYFFNYFFLPCSYVFLFLNESMNLHSSFFLRCRNEFNRKQPRKQFNKKKEKKCLPLKHGFSGILLHISNLTLLYIMGVCDGGGGGGGGDRGFCKKRYNNNKKKNFF